MVSPTPNPELIASINSDLQQAYQAEEEFWKQRSRQLWLALRDKNTGYFNVAIKERKVVNKFSVMEDEENNMVYEEEHIT